MNPFLIILTGLHLLLSGTMAQDTDSTIFRTLDPYYFHLFYLREEPSLIVDVRESVEYRIKRIKNAVNIPSVNSLMKAADTLTRDYSIFIYCDDYTRAISAAELFHQQGFRKIYILEGGLAAWKKEGMPVDRRKVKKKRQ